MIKNFNRPPNSTLTYLFLVVITLIPFLFSLLWQTQREEDFVFIFINAAIMIAPLYFIKNHKVYLSILFPLLLVPAFCDFGHIFLYQGRITESIFFIIFDTNPAESFEYIESNLSFPLIASCLLYVVSMVYFFIKVIKFEKIELNTKWWKYLLLWILIPFIGKLAGANGDFSKTAEAYRRSSHVISMVHYFNGYRKQMERFSAFNAKTNNSFIIKHRAGKPAEEIHVLVVGESTTRNKMSLYGYKRDTTPLLNQMREKLYVFNDVVSSTTGTLGNLKRIMTFANAEDESDEMFSSNIVNVFKAAGYKTYWISNQLILGTHDTITSVFARQADSATFTNTTNSTSYDYKILPVLARALKDETPKKFIVIHLLGTHMIYRNRYPDSYKKFNTFPNFLDRDFHNEKKRNYINEYDNSVLYHDYILTEILKKFESENKYISLTYLSDHGEEVYDSRNFHGHPGSSKTLNMYQIPFFIWLSDIYKKHEGANISDRLSRKYVSDDVIHTVLGLSGVFPGEYLEEKSIVNEKYIEKNRYADRESL